MDESLVTTDLSLLGLFSEADLVVKLVMLGLMIASMILMPPTETQEIIQWPKYSMPE